MSANTANQAVSFLKNSCQVEAEIPQKLVSHYINLIYHLKPRSQFQDDLLSLDPMATSFGNNPVQNKPIQPQSTGYSSFSTGIPPQQTGYSSFSTGIQPQQTGYMNSGMSSSGMGMMQTGNNSLQFNSNNNNMNTAFQQAAQQESTVFNLNSQSKNPFAAGKTPNSPFAPKNNGNAKPANGGPTLAQLQSNNTGNAFQGFNQQQQQPRNMF